MIKSKQKHIVRYYWDSCVFLAAIMGEKERESVIRSLLERCENGDLEIYTSLLSVTEVAFAREEKDANQLNPDIENAIDELWATTSPIKIIEFYDLIALEAKKLIRYGIPLGWSIKPVDAIHLATAQRIGVQDFHTYDKAVINKHKKELQDYFGFSIKEPETEPTLFDDLSALSEENE